MEFCKKQGLVLTQLARYNKNV